MGKSKMIGQFHARKGPSNKELKRIHRTAVKPQNLVQRGEMVLSGSVRRKN